jgi:hypothetical protein
MIERQAKAAIDIGLNSVLPVAKGGHFLACSQCAQLRWRAVIVGTADEENLLSQLPAKSSVDVSRQEGTYQIAEMLNSVDIGNGAGDQDF